MPSYLSYLKQVAVCDAKDDDIVEWITVRGNHIPIKKGQTKEEAVKSFIESKGGKERSLSNGGFTKGLSKKEHEKIEKHNASVRELAESTKKAHNEAFNKVNRIFAGKGTKEENEAFIKSIEETFGKNSSTAENARKKFGGTAEKSNPVPEEVGFGALEIAYNDVDFGSNADTNKKLLLNAIHESGHEEEEAMAKLVESMPTDNFKNVDSFRKALGGEKGAKTFRGKTRFGNHVGKLLTAIGSETTPSKIVVNCQEEDESFDWSSAKEAIKHAEAVDDVTGISIYGKDGKKLGWFGIEPENADGDIFDVVYNYTDNEFCNKIFKKLEG